MTQKIEKVDDGTYLVDGVEYITRKRATEITKYSLGGIVKMTRKHGIPYTTVAHSFGYMGIFRKDDILSYARERHMLAGQYIPPEYIPQKQAQTILGVGPSTPMVNYARLYGFRKIKVGSSYRYHIDDIKAHIAKRDGKSAAPKTETKTPDVKKETLTVREVAALSEVPTQVVFTATQAGVLPHTVSEGSTQEIRISVEDADAWDKTLATLDNTKIGCLAQIATSYVAKMDDTFLKSATRHTKRLKLLPQDRRISDGQLRAAAKMSLLPSKPVAGTALQWGMTAGDVLLFCFRVALMDASKFRELERSTINCLFPKATQKKAKPDAPVAQVPERRDPDLSHLRDLLQKSRKDHSDLIQTHEAFKEETAKKIASLEAKIIALHTSLDEARKPWWKRPFRKTPVNTLPVHSSIG